MNTQWLDFLESMQSIQVDSNCPVIYPINNLGALRVSGLDSSKFLQGQLTCDVDTLTQANNYFTAICNHKGRVISTLLICKQATDFLILLPLSLLEMVQQKLKRYILRSKVVLENISSKICIAGLNNLPQNFSADNKYKIIKLPVASAGYLVLAEVQTSIDLWQELIQTQDYFPQTADFWELLTLKAGIAWLTPQTSEQYIPQILNIDTLGGISFTKGCYTGQEIVARTHYLGKNKRSLLVAHTLENNVQSMDAIINADGNKVGEVLGAYSQAQQTNLLLVMRTDIELTSLLLAESETQIIIDNA